MFKFIKRYLPSHGGRIFVLLMVSTAIFVALYVYHAGLINKEPWDFRTYYFAAKTFFAGGNPYSLIEINQLTGANLELPYFYHPYFLMLISPLLVFNIKSAGILFLFFNLALVFYLCGIWNWFFEGKIKIFLLLFLFFFSFNSSFFQVFSSGNIPLLEAALLWTAFYFLIKENAVGFVVFIFAAGIFKIFILFLFPLVLFISSEKRKDLWKVFLWITVFWLIPFLRFPLLPQYFGRLLVAPFESGATNPCAYSLITDVIKKTGLPRFGLLSKILYLVWVFIVSFIAREKIKKMRWARDKQSIIIFCFLTFLICIPRLKGYNYVLAIPVAYDLISRNIELVFLPLFRLFILNDNFITRYSPFLALLFFWLYLVFKEKEG